MKRPPCADWQIWKGTEIEGDETQCGETTVFIRRPPPSRSVRETHRLLCAEVERGVRRVWLTKEFCRNVYLVNLWLPKLKKLFQTVCLEVTPEILERMTDGQLDGCTIFLKVAVPLERVDFACVGLPFADESFRIGTGRRVRPEMYFEDEKIA